MKSKKAAAIEAKQGASQAAIGEGARLLSKAEVLDRLGVTYPTVWQWMREGRFPRCRVLGGKSAWVESEVEEWIAALPVRRLKGDADVEKVA